MRPHTMTRWVSIWLSPRVPADTWVLIITLLTVIEGLLIHSWTIIPYFLCTEEAVTQLQVVIEIFFISGLCLHWLTAVCLFLGWVTPSGCVLCYLQFFLPLGGHFVSLVVWLPCMDFTHLCLPTRCLPSTCLSCLLDLRETGTTVWSHSGSSAQKGRTLEIEFGRCGGGALWCLMAPAVSV